ncbi:MAG: putative HupJ protein [Pseudomonadota bacterium]
MSNAALAARVQALEAAFCEIARTRMTDMPMLHEGVRVQAVDFTLLEAESALGVLITPWFMNLVLLPLARSEQRAVGLKTQRVIGSLEIEFTGAFEPAVGAFACCSLFSPVSVFADHEAALATAREVLRGLATQPPAASKVRSRAVSRRSLFFGRRNTGVHE